MITVSTVRRTIRQVRIFNTSDGCNPINSFLENRDTKNPKLLAGFNFIAVVYDKEITERVARE